MPLESKSVFDLKVVTWGYFSTDYPITEDRNHLGADYRADLGTGIKCHVDGHVTFVDMSNAPDSFAIIWDGHFSHIFGHLNFVCKVGPIHAGAELGKVLRYPKGGDHLHYGVNSNENVPMNSKAGWGWGRCFTEFTRSDAAKKGWHDPVMNVFSRQLAMGGNSMPLILNR